MLRALFVDFVGSLLIGISVVVFAVGANFTPGGITGFAILVNYLSGLPVGATIICMNIPIILVSYRLLGREFFLLSVKTMVISSLLLIMWSAIFRHSQEAGLLPPYLREPLRESVMP